MLSLPKGSIENLVENIVIHTRTACLLGPERVSQETAQTAGHMRAMIKPARGTSASSTSAATAQKVGKTEKAK